MTTKDELKALADDHGVEYAESDTKNDIVGKLLAAGVSRDDVPSDSLAEYDDAQNPDGQAPAPEPGGSVPVAQPDLGANAEAIEGGEVIAAPSAVGSIGTDVTPSADDETPAVVGDAKVDDGVVRTNSAVEPIADVMTGGAGAPKPPPANVDRDGREVFPDGVAPTARADYDGPGAPPEQRSE